MRRRSLIAAVTTSAGALLCAPLVAGATAAVTPAIVHAARMPAATARGDDASVRSTWAASNWSGYAETGKFTGVTGTWTVPAVSASSSATYSSAWIGVDGFNDSNLIQTGTEEDYYNGSAHYDAWWEILPAAETEISPTAYAVAPGDRMSASIWETSATSGRGRHGSGHIWDINISDTTKGWTFSTARAYTGAGSSAEWIMEAPEVGGSIATLAHYTVSPPAGTGDFDGAGVLGTIVSSGTPTYTAAALNYTNDSGVMIQNGAQVSTPGDPDTAATAFNFGYGSTLPSTPTG
jgi:Peptidase A4 family